MQASNIILQLLILVFAWLFKLRKCPFQIVLVAQGDILHSIFGKRTLSHFKIVQCLVLSHSNQHVLCICKYIFSTLSTCPSWTGMGYRDKDWWGGYSVHVCMCTCVCLCMCVYFEWVWRVITFSATVLSGLYDLAFVLSTVVATVTEGSVSQWEGSKRRWATLTLWLNPYDLIGRFEQLSSCLSLLWMPFFQDGV